MNLDQVYIKRFRGTLCKCCINPSKSVLSPSFPYLDLRKKMDALSAGFLQSVCEGVIFNYGYVFYKG